jgi:branched-subunit amino acid ABC-type transport system permease component
MSSLLQQLINGLMLGSLYALMAVGYTMVYGIIELINFAFGELFMLGAYISIMMMVHKIDIFGKTLAMPGLSFFLAVPIAMIVVALLGVLIERLAYRPLRNAPRLAALISAIGVSILLQNLAQAVFGSNQVFFPNVPWFTTKAGEAKFFTMGGAQITYLQVFVVFVTVVAMGLLYWFVGRTRIGRAMRASAQDKRTSALMGVNVNKVVAITFLVGSAMGALAGGMYGAVYNFAQPNMGFFPGLKAFIAAVLGGIGNIPGAFLGGLLLGVIESLGAAYLPLGSQYRDAFAFIILILILSFRPSGLLGSTVSQKA